MRSDTVTSVYFLWQAFIERGEKLGDLGDRSEQMVQQAESFAAASHQLMQKYKDKKWYQF